jgi:MFS transporter, ACDE family, multidrug resistance protein
MTLPMDQLTPRAQTQRFGLAEICRPPLAISFATSVAMMSGATLLYPVLPVLAASLGIEEAQIGLVMVAYTTPAIVLAPLFGLIADLHGRRWMLILGLTLFSLAGGAAAFAPSFTGLLVCRALQGVGMSMLTPLTIVLISDLLSEDQEIHGQGFKVALDRVAQILLPLLGGALAVISWQTAMLPYFLILPLALAALLWMPETRAPGSETVRQYLAKTSRALREPRLTMAFATGFLRFFLDFGLYTYLPLLAVLRFEASAAMAGWLIAASAGGSILTAMSVGHIHDRQPPQRLLAVAFLSSAIGLAAIATAQSLWLTGLGAVLFGLGNGLISPLQKSLLTRRTPPNLRGGVVAVDRVIQQIAKSLAPALMGAMLLVANLGAVFWCLAAMAALGAVGLMAVSLWRGPV